MIDIGDAGFLVQPGVHLFQGVQDAVAFSHISARRGLALLGEPGIGKSVAAHREHEAGAADSPSDQHRFIDLRGYSEVELGRKLFDSAFYKGWLESDGELHLYLDSLDECLMRVEHAASLLRDEFSEAPHERLTLRITCRTADWPTELEDNLRTWWGEDDFGAFELAPLTRGDVAIAAVANGIDSKEFLTQIDERELGPLASKPLTLGMLLNIYLREGSLPDSRLDIYGKGCLLLCEEIDTQRRRSSANRRPADERLATASRVAAATVLANKRAVWTAPDRGDVPVDDVLPSQMAGSTELAAARVVEVDEGAIRDAMATGLFTARGPHELGWAHLAYGEFLAATRLADPNLPLSTIRTLLSHPSDPSCLTPQLREVTGWLTGMRSDVREWVLGLDPRVLLRSDAAALGMHDRASLTDALIHEAGRNPARIFTFVMRPLLRKLAHPNLPQQLRSILGDRSRPLAERTLACEIAEANAVVDAFDILTEIALDQSEPDDLRVDAARAIAIGGNVDHQVALVPLLEGGITDPTDDLTGFALRALWPGSMTAEQVFELIVPYGEQTRFGAYWSFLTHDLVPGLSTDDLAIALKWTARVRGDVSSIDPVQQVICQIFERAWPELTRSDALVDEFAEAALERLQRRHELCELRHDCNIEELVSSGIEERRALVQRIITLISEREGDVVVAANRVAYAAPRLTRPDDLRWLEERLEGARPREQRAILQLIYSSFDPSVEGCLQVLVECADRYPAARSLFRPLLGPIEIASAEATQLRSSYQEHAARRAAQAATKPQRPITDLATELLGRFESGEWDAWWVLARKLRADQNVPSSSIAEPDLTTTPGWAGLDGATRGRMLAAAKRYLETGSCSPEEWLGKDTLYWPADAGYAALRLLQDADPAWVNALSATIWERWGPVVVASRTEHSTEGAARQKALIKQAHLAAPATVASALENLIRAEDAKHGSTFVLHRMPLLTGPDIEGRLFGLLDGGDVAANSAREILEYLSPVAPARVRAAAIAIVDQRQEDGDRAVGAAAAILSTQPAETFEWAMDLFAQEPEMARTVMERVGSTMHWDRKRFTGDLSEAQLGRLYRWLDANVTPRSDEGKARAMGPADFLRDLISKVLGDLRMRGTEDAIVVLRSLCEDYPEHENLPWITQEAEEVMRRSTWVPPTPREVVAVLTAPERRLIQSSHDLLAVVLESLERLQARLQGETPQAQLLWNFGETVRPKDEEALSDFVADHLKRDLEERGVIVAREVEIRHRRGGAPGEEPDIHVSAVRPPDRSRSTPDIVRLIIETKGNWNTRLFTAMESQLAARYLLDNVGASGLYLVGWYNSPQWDDADPGKHIAMKHDLESLRAQLDTQAATLSTGGQTIRAMVLDVRLR